MARPTLDAARLAARCHPASQSLGLIQERLRPALRGEPDPPPSPRSRQLSLSLRPLCLIHPFHIPEDIRIPLTEHHNIPARCPVTAKGPPHVPRQCWACFSRNWASTPALSLALPQTRPTNSCPKLCGTSRRSPVLGNPHSLAYEPDTTRLDRSTVQPHGLPRPHQHRRPVISRLSHERGPTRFPLPQESHDKRR